MIFIELAHQLQFLSIIYSLILLLGLHQIGDFIFKIKTVENIFDQISDIKYQKIFISVNFLLLIFYPIILFSNDINFIPYLSLGVFTFGIISILKNIKKKFTLNYNLIKNNSFDNNIVLTIIFLYFLLSLSPNTHGDSLGYHFVVANKLLETGKYTTDITHFHALLSGSGEILIAIGLFFGSEQFGNLVQFSGLISIFGIFKKIKKINNYYFFLLVITSPVILFLSSTSKPQLFHVCSTAVIFALYFFENIKTLSLQEKNIKMLISILILIVSVTAKFNFVLSSFLIGLIIMYNSIKDKNFYFFSLSFIFSFLVFYFPIIFWKWSNFGGNIMQYLYSPLPLNIIGFEEFKEYLIGYKRSINPFEIFFTTNLSLFTNIIGIAFFYLFLINFRNKKALLGIIIVSAYILLHFHNGQFIGRTLLEPLFWILLICAKYGVSYRFVAFEYLCRIQALVVISGIIFGIYSLLPGSLTLNQKDRVLSQNANGYGLFKWANTILKKEEVAFSMHRSISLGKANYIAVDFIPFIDFEDEKSDIYIQEIYNKNPNYFLTFGYSNEKPKLNEFKNCMGKLIHMKRGVGKYEARNPFNRGRKYDGYIFQFKAKDLPSCLKN